MKMIYKKLKKVKKTKFKRLVGIEREMFDFQVAILSDALKEKHKNGGRKPRLCVEDILLMMYSYYKDYTTFFKLGFYYDLDENNAYRWIIWAEEVLKSYLIEPLKLSELDPSKEYIVDVTECRINRPGIYETQKEYYSGKKGYHTVKVQIIIEANSKKIVHVAFDKGHVHDFTLFKKSTKRLSSLLKFTADSGYQGLEKIMPNSITPKKKPRNGTLTDEDKQLNNLISIYRIPIEHVNSQVKIFRIVSERYRNRIKTFYSRMIFICWLYNFSLII